MIFVGREGRSKGDTMIPVQSVWFTRFWSDNLKKRREKSHYHFFHLDYILMHSVKKLSAYPPNLRLLNIQSGFFFRFPQSLLSHFLFSTTFRWRQCFALRQVVPYCLHNLASFQGLSFAPGEEINAGSR